MSGAICLLTAGMIVVVAVTAVRETSDCASVGSRAIELVDKITKHVAAALRSARVAKGLTQEDLADRLGMATESISHIERAVTAPSLKTIAAAADVLDVTLLDLFNGYDKQPAKPARRAQHEARLRRFAIDLDDRRLALVVALALAVQDSD